MNTGFIYILEDPRKSDPKERDRYVGKTIKNPQSRLNSHISEAKRGLKNYRYNWIRSLLKIGLKPVLRTVKELPVDELDQEEINWIARLRKEGYKLVNGTDGGDGISGWKHSEETIKKMKERIVSEETREKKRQSMLGIKHSEEAKKRHSEASSGEKNGMHGKKGELNPMYGKSRSKETREKISKANKGKPGLKGKDNPNYGKRGVLSPSYGRKMSEEHMQKLREINTGRKHTVEARKKMSDKLKGRQLSPEHRKNLSEAAKEMHRKRREKS